MITRIHHIAIAVQDIESAFRFYRDALGLPVGRRAVVADQGVHAALLPLEEGEVELLQPANPSGGVARFLERRGEGPHHLCLQTPDVAAALARVKAAELPLIDQTPREGLAGLVAFLHPKACHGLLVELAQPQAHAERAASGAEGVPEHRGVQAVGIQTVYVAAAAAEAVGATLARAFGGRPVPAREDARFSARQVRVWVGESSITVLSPDDPSGSSDLSRFLAERGEGLYGVGLRVRDLGGALRHLEEVGIPVDVLGADTPVPLARIPASRTHGTPLFLCPLTPLPTSFTKGLRE